MKNTSEMSDMNFNCSPVVAVGCGCKKINIILLSLGTVKEYTLYSNLDYIYTPFLTSYWVSNVEMWEFTIRTETWVHAYINRELTLIQV